MLQSVIDDDDTSAPYHKPLTPHHLLCLALQLHLTWRLAFSSSPGPKAATNIIEKTISWCYLYKERGAHAWEAAEEEFDSIGDCFGLGHTASENVAKIILVSEYPKRTFADEVISFTKIFLDAKPKYSWTSLEEYFQLKTKQLRSHLLLGFVCFKSQGQNFY